MRSEDFHLITELVTEGVPNLLNICEPTFGTFPLFLAVELRKIKVIKELINLGCNVNICNINGTKSKLYLTVVSLLVINRS